MSERAIDKVRADAAFDANAPKQKPPACAEFLVCFECDGLGEWDEGPMAATSTHQLEPDYRRVICSECDGTGRVA